MDNLQYEDFEIADDMSAGHSTLQHASMVTVRLSEPQSLRVVTTVASTSKARGRPRDSDVQSQGSKLKDGHSFTSRNRPTMSLEYVAHIEEERRGSGSTIDSEGEEVDWEELEKTEEQEPRNQDSEDSTALLLARLEQENNLLATNPKSGLTRVKHANSIRNRNQARPPSMQHLKKLVNDPTPPALRYSLISAPPMTDLEFYAALVQDYTRTAQRLPTLLSKKIRSGVPPPLRGVVWQSMSGARDQLLEEQFDRLCGESSPYEGIIGKDLGRSFPGVEMFRDPDGDGQRMLGRVLKCFSLYDQKIGYCQGLGFLVGPLLMHMGDKQAFCILVRLMECYDLRNCFLPDLSGLHVRIYQFRELLKRHLPELAAHLERLQIEAAYVSQWFLSFFAVTCPLPMLFRIYDVIFAEGASETIMRVALSVMRKNEAKILASNEFEDIMQLLLSRGLWDCYHYNADEFVNDFVSLTGIVTNESLQALEASYKESRASDISLSSEIGSAASRFLGRLWSGSNLSPKSMNLSPGLNAPSPSRRSSFLFRTNSKQSLTSTLNSTDCSADSILSSTSTETLSRDSSNTDCSSVRVPSTLIMNMNLPNPNSSNEESKHLDGQIEDLLMALSDMQREQAALATQLEREREEREEDRHAVLSLLDGLRNKGSFETAVTSESEESLETVTPSPTSESNDAGNRFLNFEDTAHESEIGQEDGTDVFGLDARQRNLAVLLDTVEDRFSKRVNRRSSMLQSKSQLRQELARSKEQLIAEVSKSQDLNQRLKVAEQEIITLKDQVREGHTHIRNAHQEKQRLEKQIYDFRSRRSSTASTIDGTAGDSDWPKQATGSGLRELRLGRTNSTRSQAPSFTKRSTSLNTQTFAGNDDSSAGMTTPPAVDNDALLLELVQSKTAEAIAKQEAEEAKAKLENLRKLMGLNTTVADAQKHKPSPSQGSLFSSYIGRSSDNGKIAASPAPVSAMSATSATGGGFWGGWGKRSVS